MESGRKLALIMSSSNDCFINSSLQALAGLGDLRLYLIRELHRRKLYPDDIYERLPEDSQDGRPVDARKLLSLLKGDVTKGLKEILDGLNERPIYRKTISAAPFIRVLECAFDTRINRNQQDAQELLQVVAQRLAEEYEAGKAARRRAREGTRVTAPVDGVQDREPIGDLKREMEAEEQVPHTARIPTVITGREDQDFVTEEEENGFPLEGQTKSEIECLHCHFIPHSKPTAFVMLTLTVPQKSFATLNECFDDQFKTEIIDDYKCDKCRLEHAISLYKQELTNATAEQTSAIQSRIERIQEVTDTNPEELPPDLSLPDSKLAPTRRIARHMSITSFPSILVIHLSRSVFDPRSYSSKNTAKVVFPERLPLGSLLDRRHYKLLGMIIHKGTHNSGHYETFRRQHVYEPVSNPNADYDKGPYGSPYGPTLRASAQASPEPAPVDPRDNLATERIGDTPRHSYEAGHAANDAKSAQKSGFLSPTSPISPRRSTSSIPIRSSMSTQTVIGSEADTSQSRRGSSFSTNTLQKAKGRFEEVKEEAKARRRKKKGKENDRWWRISDDKTKECKTADVLDMQKEVYMLFYELEKG